MTRRLVLVFSVVVVAIVGCSSEDAESEASTQTQAVAVETVTIMAIGDTFTESEADACTYRYYLDEMLTAAGVSFDMVGSEELPAHLPRSLDPEGELLDYGCPGPFDYHHQASFYGRIDEMKRNWTPVIAEYQPDVALIHLGTNDLTDVRTEGPEATAANLEEYIVAIQEASPKTSILVAQIIPCEYGQESDTITALCAEVPRFNEVVAGFDALSTDTSPVFVVDMYTGFGSEMVDQPFRPNEAGHEWIADRWMAALEAADLIEATS